MGTAESKTGQLDGAGLETLELFADAGRFNQWMFDQIEPYCGGTILEIGSGIGNISALLLERFRDVTLSDVNADYLDILSRRFGGRTGLRGVQPLDIGGKGVVDGRMELEEQFDVVVALNVVEHIADHETAVLNCFKLLKPGGRLILLVPAFSCLYNGMDEELAHYRRYNSSEVRALLSGKGFWVDRLLYFNAAGILGWWVWGSILKMRRLKKGPLSIYSRLVPAIGWFDTVVGHRVGLSVIGVGCKPKNNPENI